MMYGSRDLYGIIWRVAIRVRRTDVLLLNKCFLKAEVGIFHIACTVGGYAETERSTYQPAFRLGAENRRVNSQQGVLGRASGK